ncbi:MAG: glutathione S-transferase N-terminal domain-containing protein [Burkholderiales bacterium]|nr:glutathione S-transferase N-terminal domain-containing protein [Burkholderiales bacterium]
MLEVLGRPNSINVRKVLWTCAEAGLPIRHVPWGAGDLSLASAEFRALNPMGLVPVLRDPGARDGRDLVLRESNTICRYLATRARRHDLLPEDAAARAEVEQWMDWMATELNNAWRTAFMGLVRKSPAHQDAAAITASAAEWNRQMGFLEQALQASGAFATAHGFTLADIVLGLATHRWVMTPIAHADLPAVRAYYERLSQRPAFLAHGRNGIP